MDAALDVVTPAAGPLRAPFAPTWAPPPARPRATLQVFPEGAVWVGTTAVDTPHEHFTASIKVGLAGPFRMHTTETGWITADAVLTGPSVRQQLDAPGALIANVMVDPESDAFARLAPRLAASGGGVHVADAATASALRLEVLSVLGRGAPFVQAWDAAVDRLGHGSHAPRRVDARVRRVADALKREFSAPPRLGDLAARVRLSEGRLTHLFTEQMGLSLRQYVLWLRIRDVVLSLASGATLTQAAHDAGFADSPHLSRTFRSMFGDPPSVLVPGRGHFELQLDEETARRRPGPHGAFDVVRRNARTARA